MNTKPADPSRLLPPGTNVDACAMFFGTLAGAKKRNIGDRPHVCTLPHSLLDPLPLHSRRKGHAKISTHLGTCC